ncbi:MULTISPECIES: pyruvate, phosphate dikinase [Nocardioides]|uniref:Pyruvate, phosphate dikinase n=1 Tax=Nocardioides vastitatis TaxID=2568655 RepID=A0ABW0ZK42_9ACTN|nr:pyruvate, phosphate dikinase [Nocardioides sp.]THJ06217.1 pyruvate, phosphate dikinase [Nocardioides sp.]
MIRYVHSFSSFGTPDRLLLGGKGADLAQMVQLGLPVPPGFTITTEACRHYLENGAEPPGLQREVSRDLALLEEQVGHRLGDIANPLLLAVRSGAATSMPGMMDTVLDIGLNDRTVVGLAAVTGDERFALDCYRRLLQMFGETVFGIPDDLFAGVLDAVKAERGVEQDLELDADAVRVVVERNKALYDQHAGRPMPQDPQEQLSLAVDAVFRSWHSDRAALYRRRNGISDDLGTAVNVQVMVFGNRGPRSGSGVAFTRDPATGDLGDYGEYLPTAQGEDVVSGVRTAVPLAHLRDIDLASYRRLRSVMGTLERHYRDMCDIEFTIEEGRLWILQTRVGKRSPAAAFRIAADLVEEGWITRDEALLRVTGEQLTQLMFPRFEAPDGRKELAVGLAASPGAAVGRVVLDSATAVEWAGRGEDVILVRKETRPEDLAGMVAAKGVLTSRGGRTSHAAVVARAMGLPCVCGAGALEIDLDKRQVSVGAGRTIAEGDVISLDGASGGVFLGARRTVDSEVVQWLEGGLRDGELISAVAGLLDHADAVRRLRIRANADTHEDAARAMRFGAEGIGLCRTEHMFLGDRRTYLQRVILAADEHERTSALAQLLRLQRGDFESLLAETDGQVTAIRLLDAPLHEFLPDLTQMAVRVALAEKRGGATRLDRRRLADAQRVHEENPMTGLRGVRLGIVHPDLVRTQALALFEAAADVRDRGGRVDLELMVPLVSTAAELEFVQTLVMEVAEDVARRRGDVDFRFGTMVETPRAALTAGQLARSAEFLSFGTNDLTQLTWGFSRDDVERSVLPRYLDAGVLRQSPFASIDVDGVGSLVKSAVEQARAVRPEIAAGVCGEHGGDPASIHFFDGIGIDYVSCSPFRIPVARLEAGRAALLHRSEPAAIGSRLQAEVGTKTDSRSVTADTTRDADTVGARR